MIKHQQCLCSHCDKFCLLHNGVNLNDNTVDADTFKQHWLDTLTFGESLGYLF